MTNITLPIAQLKTLLQAQGIDRPVGFAPSHFENVKSANAPDLTDEEQALITTVANPQFVIRSHKEISGAVEETHWFYITGDHVVNATTDSAEWALTRFGDIRAVLHHIERALTPRPVLEEDAYKFVADSEDVLLVQDMRDVWAAVPALSIIESYGLDVATATELFDATAAPEWRGRIDFMRCQNKDVIADHTILIVQGGGLSWVGYPRSQRKQHLVIETAQSGVIHSAIEDGWNLINSV
ncbi:MAG: hypothetical protein M9928_08355 [Anaerolineae bacterium]|nr:hypothetical protein [Anaerolineae bacterium]MCO5199147.1 hypothetical protein [Anaerolineae bacterium]MCO5205028.1 hypothetical protein [Anaerolineae bacterium]